MKGGGPATCAMLASLAARSPGAAPLLALRASTRKPTTTVNDDRTEEVAPSAPPKQLTLRTHATTRAILAPHARQDTHA